MEVPPGVLPDSPPVIPEDGKNQPPVVPDVPPVVVPPVPPVPPAPVPPVPTPPAPGSQTPEEKLLLALQEERRQKKELEDKLLALTSEPPSVTEAFSDEGKMLETKIQSLESELSSLREEKVLEAIQSRYPVLKELSAEFGQFRTGYAGVEIEKIAKLFLNEKGLLGTPRKGLEKPAGGGPTPPASDKLTAEEVADLRKNNHRKYTEMLMSGQIRLDELS